ncbi:hypothetical protein CVT24_011256 [Panaeolus cyanescens]|uniref:Uncharacterized protein n=1 Tax=Panaeolus cyanescens TaxID=181874 RepID=A0A409VI40_9AGAR|nr:hypothetical protein CVT24_011256 [Panaeolus cyanescens]
MGENRLDNPLPMVWLITGSSCGFGRALAIEVLSRGDKVIATGRKRSMDKVTELEAYGAAILELDVTSPLETLHDIVAKAVAFYGRIDVLVNNAGYLHVGTLEESTPKDSLDLYNTNVFGALNVTRAVLPYMRARSKGTVAFIGSMAGHMHGFAYSGLYVSTKWAIRGLCATLQQEIQPLGLRAICIDPGFFRTELFTPGRRAPRVDLIKDYKDITDNVESFFDSVIGNEVGDPLKGAKIMVDIIREEGVAKGKAFPTSVCLGSDCYDVAKKGVEKTLEMLEDWASISPLTDFETGG